MPHLLRGHIQRRADQLPFLGNLLVFLPRDTKIENLGVARGVDVDILWLDVTMDDLSLMQIQQAAGDLPGDGDEFWNCAQFAALKQYLQGRAV